MMDRKVIKVKNGNFFKGSLDGDTLSFKERETQLAKEREQEEAAQKRAKKSPYKSFVQRNVDDTASKRMRELMVKNGPAAAIFELLMAEMDGHNAIIASHKVIAKKLGISLATVNRSIVFLKKEGFVKVFKTGNSNLYALDHNICWKSYGNNLKNSLYAKIDAYVMLDLLEQDKDIQEEALSKEELAAQIKKQREEIEQTIVSRKLKVLDTDHIK